MASEDVIELGSSDDEAEPAAKKIKPMPNAMVHIPRKFHDVTIKPAKKPINPVIPKELAGKNVTVTKIPKGNLQANPYAIKIPNGKQIPPKQSMTNQLLKKPAMVHINPNVISKSKMVYKPIKIQNKQNVVSKNMISLVPNKPNLVQGKPNVNPLNIMKKINSQVAISKISSTPKVLKNPIRINSPQTINKLPSSITVTRTAGNQKRKACNQINSMQKKHKINRIPESAVGEVLTVELDDDDVSSSSTASPLWYLRPEEPTSIISELEEANNKEPEPCKSTDHMIEITIEDSPLKPIKDKRACEIGTEHTVTIDDSPVKTALEKNAASGSDGEVKTVNIVPHSKKKLEYPKEHDVFNDILEIEISPVAVDSPQEETEGNTETTVIVDNVKSSIAKADKIEASIVKEGEVDTSPTKASKLETNSAKAEKVETSGAKADEVEKSTAKTDKVIMLCDEIIEIEESPLKVQAQGTSTPKKDHPKPKLAVPESIKQLQDGQDLSEFHPAYQSFIRLCFQLENSDDMKKIVEKKIKTYYRQVPREYTESEDFIDMVSGKVLSMKAAPEKMYLYIKDIVDELNLQRKMAKSQILSSIHENKSSEPEKYLYGTDSEFDSKRQRQIRKLEKTLKKLHRAIQKLEEQEVDFDDDEDSVYLLTESDEGSSSNKDSDRQLEKEPKALLQRYKERMVRVHAKFCQLTNTKMPSEPRVQLDARPGQASGPAKRLEKWINKKVPIGTPLPFPDFHDVLRCVRDANEEDKLGWNEADIMEEARDLFTRCGKKLQRRRQENEWRIAASRISVEVDPAEKNQELMRELDENKKIAAKKEAEVFNKYADRQKQLKLEGEEIGDKEAEESPPDDDEDEHEANNEISLNNKEKRKERLRRLLQEKSKKGVPENEITSDDKSQEGDEKDSKKSDEVDSQNHIEEDKKGNAVDVVKSQNYVKDDKRGNAVNAVDGQNNIEEEKKENAIDKTADEVKEISPEPEIQNAVKESVKTVELETIVLDSNENANPTRSLKDQDSLYKESVKNNEVNIADRIHSISDDSSNKLESDIDEHHLLQKLHSENEVNSSTLESSDSESPIANSDTLSSGGDLRKPGGSDDVISIENSSYSESELNKDVSDFKESEPKNDKIVEEIVDVNTELECSSMGIAKKQIRTNNDEFNESIEDILLASTDDEVEIDKSLKPENEEDCVNLKDDSISIGDTVVEGVDKTKSSASDSSSPREQDDACSVESVSSNCLNNDLAVNKTLGNSKELQDDASSMDSVTCVLAKDDTNAESSQDTDSKDADECQQNETHFADICLGDTVGKSPDSIQGDFKDSKKQEDASSTGSISLITDLTATSKVEMDSKGGEITNLAVLGSEKEIGSTSHSADICLGDTVGKSPDSIQGDFKDSKKQEDASSTGSISVITNLPATSNVEMDSKGGDIANLAERGSEKEIGSTDTVKPDQTEGVKSLELENTLNENSSQKEGIYSVEDSGNSLEHTEKKDESGKVVDELVRSPKSDSAKEQMIEQSSDSTSDKI